MGTAQPNSRVTQMCPQLYDLIMPSMSGQKSMQYYNFRIQQESTRSVELKQLGVTLHNNALLLADIHDGSMHGQPWSLQVAAIQ